STFTIIRIVENAQAEIIQYDNPHVILFRNGLNHELSSKEMTIGGKKIFHTRTDLYENDVFIAMSDGVVHAGIGHALNFGWERGDIINFMGPLSRAGYTARTLTTMLLDQCNRLYGGKPGDDATVCTLHLRRRTPVNLLIGPPANPDDCARMLSLFFSKRGKHIVCGGTTSAIAADFLGEQLIPSLDFEDHEIPPTAKIQGVDLVTEGVITINKVLSYAQDYIAGNALYDSWSRKKDGASRIARLLLEEATDINFYVGKAVNPAHQNPELPIGFSIKMQLVDELAACLKKMGKRIKVSYF
ncbi:MAG: serine/threonine-protein phosphatase, partial [Christensenellales bacterium]